MDNVISVKNIRIIGNSYDANKEFKDELTDDLHSLTRVIVVKSDGKINENSDYVEFKHSTVLVDLDTTSYFKEVSYILGALIKYFPEISSIDPLRDNLNCKGSTCDIIVSKIPMFKVMKAQLMRMYAYLHSPDGFYSYNNTDIDVFIDELYVQGVISKHTKFFKILELYLPELIRSFALKNNVKINVSFYDGKAYRNYHHATLNNKMVERLTKNGKIKYEHIMAYRDAYYHAALNSNYVLTQVMCSVNNFANLTPDQIHTRIMNIGIKKTLESTRALSKNKGHYEQGKAYVEYISGLYAICDYGQVMTEIEECANMIIAGEITIVRTDEELLYKMYGDCKITLGIKK